MAVYANTLANLFVWDDAWVVADNQFIRAWKNFPLLFSQKYLTPVEDFGIPGERQIGSGESSYRPIVTASYFIDYSLWGSQPWGYHFTNLLIHLINSILLYFLVVALSKEKTIALFASLLFALHPANSEAVSVISFREDLLAFLFFVSSFMLYIRKRPFAYALSLVLFLLALFSKEAALTLPVILILYDFYFEENREFNPVYLGYFASCIFFLWVWGFLFHGSTLPLNYAGGNFFTNTLTMLTVVSNYLAWVILPLGIHAIVPDSRPLIVTALTAKAVCGILLILASIMLAIKSRRAAKSASFGMFWFFIALVPAYNLIPVLQTLMAGRFLYIPLAGFCLFISALLFRKKPLKKAVAFAVLILLFYSCITMQRNRVYRNNISLWSEMASFYPDSALAHTDLGVAFEKAGLWLRASGEYRLATMLDPDHPKAYFGLGNAYFMQGLPDSARLEYKKGLKLLKSERARAEADRKINALF